MILAGNVALVTYEGRDWFAVPPTVGSCGRARLGRSLYAKRMTTGDIANQLADIYGSQVSKDLVSRVTDAVVANMSEWQSRPLDPVCPVQLLNAL